jgi:F-type H+-transporting ATPase subunit b
MPQLDQLPQIFASQLFWLAIVFGIIFFVIGRGMLPKIEATIDARDRQIADDLLAAEKARAQADETELAYRQRVEESKAEAMRLTQASKVEVARESEAQVKATDAEIGVRTRAAEDQIRAASVKAMEEIEKVAAEIAQELVAKLASVKVTKDRASDAVKAVLNG